MNRVALFMLTGLTLTVPFGPDDAQAAPSLRQSFEEAGREYNVPPELLMGVSYTVTSWQNARGVDAHSAREFGVMGLRDQYLGPSLDAASTLTGVAREALLADQDQNIRGGAALLAAYAREANQGRAVGGELSLENARLWWDAVGRYSGVADARHQDLFAAHVFETLDSGAEGRAESGELVILPAIPLPSLIGDWIDHARFQQQRQQEAMTPAVDYSGATWVAACSSNYSNYSRTAADISYVVIHKIEGSYSGCISWFQNCSASVSAHYVVSKYGEVTQMVKEEDVAWHAGNWDYNLMSVGIEHEGYTNSDDVTDAEYQGSAKLTKDVCDRNGISKSRSYIIGHNEVPGATHTDPGPYWDWDYYMSLVGGSGGGGGGSTGNLVGYIREDDIYTGAGISGATVKLNNGQSVTTDANGYYTFKSLPTGTYTVTADADCYSANNTTKTVSAGIDNWASIPLTDDGTCGGGDGTADGAGDGPGDYSCKAVSTELGGSKIHTASVNPARGLSFGTLATALGVAGLLFSRRRRS